MSHRTIRSIDIDLTRSSIDRAIREIETIKQQLVDGINSLMRTLTEEGEEIAKMQIVSMGAVDSGELERSIHGYFDPQTRIGYVTAGAIHAVFVEFGTGIVGESEPHPVAGEAGWAYDVNDHGNDGWVYRKGNDGVFSGNGGYYWTRGYVARPFMYNTLQWLAESAEENGAEIILREM